MRDRVTRPTPLIDASIALLSAGGLALVSFIVGRASADESSGVLEDRGSWRAREGAASAPSPQPGPSDAGHGRDAASPSAVPAKGWIDILWRTYGEFSRDRLMLVAAGITFYVLLSLFPAITAMISIYGLFADAGDIRNQLGAISGVLPSGAVDIIGEQMMRVTSQGDGKLGFGMIFGLGLALWSANAGMKTLFDALNIVYEEDEKRGFVRLTLVTLGFTIGTILVLILALSSVVVLPVVLKFVGLGSVETWLLLLRWPLLLVVVAAGLTLIYREGPSRKTAKWRWLSWGAAVAAVLWVVFSILFSWYVQSFGSYDKTYGSLGAVIGFMTWIWISTIVILLGAELNSELEHQTTVDSTTHSNRPMGERGAQMADTLGATRG